MRDQNEEMSEKVAALGSKCMDYLIGNPEQLSHFMTHAGVSPDMLRANIGGHEIALGAIDYFAHNESALLAMCANSGVDASDFMLLWQRLNPNA